MGLAHSPRVVRDGLALYLDAANPKSYPASGTTWKDISGSGNDGTLVNGVGFDSANNGSMVFDGGNDKVELGGILSQEFSQITFSFICKYQGYTRFPRIIAKNHDTWTIFFDSDNTVACFAAGVQLRNQIDIELDKWFFGCFVYTGSELRGYINSTFVAKEDGSGTISPNSGPVTIGSSTQARYFDGNISNVQVYDRALSEAEIKQNFNALRGRYGV